MPMSLEILGNGWQQILKFYEDGSLGSLEWTTWGNSLIASRKMNLQATRVPRIYWKSSRKKRARSAVMMNVDESYKNSWQESTNAIPRRTNPVSNRKTLFSWDQRRLNGWSPKTARRLNETHIVCQRKPRRFKNRVQPYPVHDQIQWDPCLTQVIF